MARPKKVLSKAEIAAARKDLTTALKVIKTEQAKYTSDCKAAEKALADAKKQASKLIADAQKAVEAAEAKAAKAAVKADAGRAKIEAKLASLEPAKEAEAA